MNIEDFTKQAKRRINIIKGQLDGLYKMIESDKYCTDVLEQSLSIQNSLKSLDSLILEKHLKTHVSELYKKDEDKAIGELLEVFRRKQKNG